jgi:hypothetical protein
MNNFNTTKKNKVAALVAMAAIVAVVPAMLGGLISVGNVNVLSPNCDQQSEQTQASFLSKLLLQSSKQTQDCDSIDIL